MKNVFRSAAMAFSMFSIIPMPRVEWKKENMRYMLCCLPLVGIVIALVLWGWFELCRVLNFGSFLFAAGGALLPVFVSGGIHLDGFCDTADALSSHAAPERKREILKDSHAGAFAIIFAVCFFIMYTALCSELEMSGKVIFAVGLQHVTARSAGALASVVFPGSGSVGLLASFRDAGAKKSSLILSAWTLVCAAGLIAVSPAGGCASVLMTAICLVYLRRMSVRQFGGMSGDLAGFFITLSELMMLLGFVFAERVFMLWF